MAVDLQPADQVEVDQYISLVREQLDDEQFEIAWAEGRQMYFEKAIAYACGGEGEQAVLG